MKTRTKTPKSVEFLSDLSTLTGSASNPFTVFLSFQKPQAKPKFQSFKPVMYIQMELCSITLEQYLIARNKEIAMLGKFSTFFSLVKSSQFFFSTLFFLEQKYLFQEGWFFKSRKNVFQEFRSFKNEPLISIWFWTLFIIFRQHQCRWQFQPAANSATPLRPGIHPLQKCHASRCQGIVKDRIFETE